ncbi:hypothetical protein FRACA_3130002 [Frankia canadensis]|uniref:Uncharacterized protein n=1 Tax=Frankia canadensis TaxID=1836972 RepID=A0A2I2KUC2_9ACTN|nr:hypothetical protein FRACA_3130002 [Frankia canadensis]SOU56557.1 hypothetical protein FRACA_3130002 [Frankia canadensis]
MDGTVRTGMACVAGGGRRDRAVRGRPGRERRLGVALAIDVAGRRRAVVWARARRRSDVVGRQTSGKRE